MLAVVISVRASSACVRQTLRFTRHSRAGRIQNSPQRGVWLLTKLRSTRFTVATLWDLAWVPACAGTTWGWGKAPRWHTNHSAIRDSLHPIHLMTKSRFSVPCPSRLAALPPRKARRASQKTGGSPPCMFEATAQPAQVQGGPGFREAQGTPGAAGGGRARVLGSFFAYFLWRSKERNRQAGRTPAQNQTRASARILKRMELTRNIPILHTC